MRRLAGRRGSVLLHVLLTSVVVALVAATVLRMSLLRVAATARSAVIVQEKRDDQQMLAAILSVWNSAGGGGGQTCPVGNITIAGNVYNRGGGPAGRCGCRYTPAAQTTPPTLPSFTTTGGTPDNCAISITSALRQ